MVAATRRMSSSGAPWRMTMSMARSGPGVRVGQLRSGAVECRPRLMGRIMMHGVCQLGESGRTRLRTLNLGSFSQTYPHDGGDTRLLHGHTIHGVGRLHGPGVVG